MLDCWFCCATAADSRDWDRDWDRELSGEVEREDEELKEDDRARDPGMLTGADPASDLWPGGDKRETVVTSEITFNHLSLKQMVLTGHPHTAVPLL